jgi:hypothetical protein
MSLSLPLYVLQTPSSHYHLLYRPNYTYISKRVKFTDLLTNILKFNVFLSSPIFKESVPKAFQSVQGLGMSWVTEVSGVHGSIFC